MLSYCFKAQVMARGMWTNTSDSVQGIKFCNAKLGELALSTGEL